MTDYIEDMLREKIVKEIEYLELPEEWSSGDVIKYVVQMIRKGTN